MTEPTAGPDGVNVAPTNLAHDSVVLQLEISTAQFRRKVDSRTIVENAGKPEDEKVDSNFIHTSKDLIDRSAAEYRAITTHASQFKNNWLKLRTLPCGMLHAGMYLAPTGNVVEIDRGIVQFILERKKLVANLIAVIARLKDEAERKLGPQFDVEDYPTDAELEKLFDVNYRFWSFNVPAALKSVNKELFEREQARVAGEMKAASEEIQNALRESFAGLVDHLVDRLTPGEDGKAKTFRGTTVDNFKNFLDTFASRNLTGDGDLSELVAQAKALMGGVKPDVLRKQETTRDRVKEGFEKIKLQLAPLLISRRRAFSFDKDETPTPEAAPAAPVAEPNVPESFKTANWPTVEDGIKAVEEAAAQGNSQAAEVLEVLAKEPAV